MYVIIRYLLKYLMTEYLLAWKKFLAMHWGIKVNEAYHENCNQICVEFDLCIVRWLKKCLAKPFSPLVSSYL